MTLQSLLPGDYTTTKAILLLAFYAAAMIVACVTLWNENKSRVS